MVFERNLQRLALVTAVLTSLWFYTQALDPFNITKLAVLAIGAAATLGMLAAGWKLWWDKTLLPVTALVGVFLAGLTAAAFASDQAFYRTFWGAWARNNGWLAYATLAVVLLAFVVAFRGDGARQGMYGLVLVGGFEAFYGTLQTFGADPIKWNNGYNAIIGTVGNPNFASALLGVAGVAMMWLTLDATHANWQRWGGGVAAGLALWLTVRSDSIQGTLAFGAGLAVLLAGWMSLPERSAWLRRLLLPYLALGAAGFTLGVIGLTGRGPLGGVLFSQNLVNRTYYWRAGWRMFQQDPLFGIGLDSFGDWYRVVRLAEQVAATGVQTSSNAAHSVVFQMLATGGLAFFGTFLLIQLFVVWRAIAAWRSGQNRLLVAGVFGAWFAFLLQSLFSIDQLGLTVWGWALSGLVIAVSYANPYQVSTSRKRGEPSEQALALPLIAAAFLALGAVILVSGPLGKDSDVREVVTLGVDQANAAQVDALIAQVDAVVGDAKDPMWVSQGVSKLISVGRVEEAIVLAKRGVAAYPNDLHLWHVIAAAYEQTGRPALAVEARQRSVELDPLNSEYAKLLEQDHAAE